MQEYRSHNHQSKSSLQASRQSWFDAFTLSWHVALHMNMSQMMVLKALRGVIGIVFPLVVGLITGHRVEGATIAGGAALWTVMNMTSPNHARLRVLFLSCASMGTGAFLGSLIGTLPVVPILVVGAVAFIAGLLVAVSLPVALIGMQSLVAVLFLMSFARDPLHAFFQAVLVFIGALLAFLLEISFSPWRHTGAERKTLSLFFERLAETASATDDHLEEHNKDLRAALVQSQLRQEANYPWEGAIKLGLQMDAPTTFCLKLRVPGWCRQAVIRVNGEAINLEKCLEQGYAGIERLWQNGDQVQVDFALPVERVYAHPAIAFDLGRVALQRGPLVYCLESADNPVPLECLLLPANAEIQTVCDPQLFRGAVVIQSEGLLYEEHDWAGNLYRTEPPRLGPYTMRAIPYYLWDNRAAGEMRVWLRTCS